MMKSKNKVVLSISLLTSNRKDTIRKCLDSLTPLREQVDSELIIVDTGCDEEMLGIIEEYADQIVKFEWCNDFAKARNAGLEKASGEWFLFIDDDEWFEDVSEIVAFFKEGEYQNYTIGKYMQRNYGNMQGNVYEDVWVVRMAKFGSMVRFEGCIHEALHVYDGAEKYFHDFVHHYGYVFTSEEERYRHYQRNASLLQKMLVQERHNMRWWTHLAQEYWTVDEHQKLLDLCQEALEMMRSMSYVGIEKTRGCFYVGRVQAAAGLGQYEDAIKYLKEALSDRGNSRMCLTRLFTLGAEAYYERKEYANCIECIRYYLVCYQEADFEKEKEKDSIIFIHDAYEEYIYCRMLSLILSVAVKENDIPVIKEYFDQIKWLQETLSIYDGSLVASLVAYITSQEYDEYFVHMAQIFMEKSKVDSRFHAIVRNSLINIEQSGDDELFLHAILIFSQVKANDDYIDYLKIRAVGMGLDIAQEQLQRCYESLFCHTDNIFALNCSIWEIAKERRIDLEPFLLAIEFDAWTQMIDAFCENIALEQIDYYENIFCEIQTQKNIRYQYFYMRMVEARMFCGEAREDYEALHYLLQEFVDAQIGFYFDYYGEEAFDGGVELLPDSCKVAIYLNEAFQREAAGDYHSVLLILKESIGIYLALSEVIQTYSHLYVEELKKKL